MALSQFFQKLQQKNVTLGHALCLATVCIAITLSTFTLGPLVWVVGVASMLIRSRTLDNIVIGITNRWIDFNNWLINNVLPPIEIHIDMPDNLAPDKQYLLVCNHQSWVDTTLMQYVGFKDMPLTRFFTKWELIYLPFVGQAFYFLGFPMMRRHSKEAIAKNPNLKNQDVNEAKRACAKIATMPFTLLNYLEGTRFTPSKHDAQQSPYHYLLKPKAGGLALAIGALGQQIDGFLDMTIVYPDGIPKYSDFWQGKVKRIGIDIQLREIPTDILTGDYYQDPDIKEKMYVWIDSLWQQKDAKMATMLTKFNPNEKTQ